jgi:hypothetical protein
MHRPCYDLASSAAPLLHHSGGGSVTSMNHYTGTMTTSIPLVPGVSLSYTASGIRVDQIASWVGLGWQLNVGGVITRTVRGYPDEISDYNIDPNQNLHVLSGWKTDPYDASSPYGSVGERINDFDPDQTDPKTLADDIEDIIGVAIEEPPNSNAWKCYKEDTEPDEFHFSFPGGNGKFYLDDSPVEYSASGTWNTGTHIIPQSNYQISFMMSGASSVWTDEYINKFKIIDDNGTQYIYEDCEFVTSTTKIPDTDAEYIGGPPSGNFVDQTLQYGKYVQSWFLTKIIAPSGDIIEFTYIDEEVRLEEGFYEVYRGFQNDGTDSPEYTLERNVVVEVEENGTTDTYMPIVQTKRLSEINGKDFKIEFIANQSREDLYTTDIDASNLPMALTQINYFQKVGNETPELVKQIQLFYDYFETDATTNASLGFSQYYNSGESYTMKRLRLNSVQALNQDKLLPPYEFTYYDTYAGETDWLPSRYSYCQDLWGYFNEIETNTTLIPAMDYDANETGYLRFELFPGTSADLPGADREASGSSAIVSVGSLKQIQLPAGGTYKYEYEPNDFIFNGSREDGGGIRLSKFTISSDVGSSDIVTTYTYLDGTTSSGKPILLPIYGYFDPTNVGECDYTSNSWTDDDYNNFYVRTPFNIMEMSDGSIGYSKVTVENQGGETGKTEYIFNNEATFADYATEGVEKPFETASVNYVPSVTDLESYCTNAPPYSITATPYEDEGLDWGVHSYPYPPNSNYNWWRGLLEQVNQYEKNNSQPIEKVFNTYNLHTSSLGKTDIYGLKISTLRNKMQPDQTSGCGSYNYLIQPLHIFSKYTLYADLRTIQSSTKKETYVSSTDFIEQKETFTINNFGQTSSINKPQSDGSIIITRYKYPPDIWDPTNSTPTSYADDYAEAIVYMVENNMWDYPVEALTLRKENVNADEKVIAASLITYSIQELNNNGTTDVPMPYQTYILEVDEPIDLVTAFDFAVIGTNGSGQKEFSWDSNYELVSTIEYDNYGNTILYQEKDQLPHASVFRYDNNRLVADIINSHYNEILYEDFEYFSESSSLWTTSGTYAISSTATSSKSGSKVLSLAQGAYGQISTSFTSSDEFLTDQDGYTITVWAKGASGTKLTVTAGQTTKSAISSSSTDWNLLEVIFSQSEIDAMTLPINITCKLSNDNTSAGDVYFDDLRFSPSDGVMTTRSFDMAGQVLSTSDANNQYIYHEYDELGRVVIIRDDQNRILSSKDYHSGDLAEFTYYVPDGTHAYLRSPVVEKQQSFKLIPSHTEANLTHKVTWEEYGTQVSYNDPTNITHSYSSTGKKQITHEFTKDGVTYSHTRTIYIHE